MGDSFVWSLKNGELEQVRKIVEAKGPEVIKKEIENGRMALHFAADYGQTDVMEYLISKGADVNQQDKHGISPLLAAIWEGHTSCVKLLLEKGAKKDGKSPDGSRLIECAETQDIKDLLK
ncbi:LOW QUALITY PROTEIN: myotrophin-like [Liolophura sinensis]|uniref:LOW QUALITY PROTEIN: myotrophin-like n=1 Tax=Liolophura sinensis TaxID=3198878 RepID=UPI003158CD0E